MQTLFTSEARMFSLICNSSIVHTNKRWVFSSPGNLASLHRSQGGGFQEHQVHRRVSLRRAHQRCQGTHLNFNLSCNVGAKNPFYCRDLPTATQSRRRMSWSVWPSPTDKHRSTGSQSWRRNERPSFLPTSAQTWKYLLVHAKLLYLGNHSCILAEILVDLRQWGPSGERRGWGGWRGRGGRWGQGSRMWNNVMYTQVLKMMLNLPTLYEKTW